MWPVTLAIGCVFLLQGLLNTSPNLTVFFLVFGTFAVGWAFWPRVILSDDGVTVINLRSRKLAWGEITGAEAKSRWGTVNLVLHTVHGDVRALGMRGAASGITDSTELVEDVAAQVNAHAAGATGAATPAPPPALA